MVSTNEWMNGLVDRSELFTWLKHW